MLTMIKEEKISQEFTSLIVFKDMFLRVCGR